MATIPNMSLLFRLVNVGTGQYTMFLSVVELDSDINKCCPACFNRIARMMGTNPQTNEPLVAQVPDDNTDGEFIYSSSPDSWYDEDILGIT